MAVRKQLTGAPEVDSRTVREIVYADFFLKNRTVQLFGDIDDDQAFSIAQTAHYFGNTKGDVTVMINSRGGSVYSALSIYDELSHLYVDKGIETTGIVTGVCMSAAVTVLQAFSKRLARKHAAFMVHEVSSMSGGSLSVQDNALKQAKLLQGQMLGIVKERIGLVAWKSLKLRPGIDKYLTAEEALAVGLIDGIV